MSNVRIGPDGSIIKDEVVIESEGRTIIREDGTIETTSVAGNTPVINRGPMVAMPPVSPLERNSNNASSNSAPVNSSTSAASTTTPASINVKAIAEKEYDIQMQEAKIRNAFPKNMIIATIVLCVLGMMGLYFLFIPAIVTGIMIFVGINKKSELEAEKERMYIELDNLKSGTRR